MTREDREIISEALNRICACIAAIATVLEGTEAEGQPRGSPENAEPAAVSSGPANTPETAAEASEPPEGKQAAPPAEKTAETPPLPACTYEEAREVLSVKAKNGYRAEVKALLTKHGIRQLSDVHDPEMFAILKAEAGDIGNG